MRGSPPQVRGKGVNDEVIQLILWITPAGAGKSFFSFALCLKKRDHPRRCGEKACLSSRECKSLGSPPQVRGKALILFQWSETGRITPAGAGKRQDYIPLLNQI